MSTGAFSIDDAFDSEDDDKIRLYGSTKETAPLRTGPKIRPPNDDDEHSKKSSSSKESKTRVAGNAKLTTTRSTHSLSSTWSDDTRVSTRSFSDGSRWWRHPKIRDNCKVVAGSIALTVIGLALVVTGVAITISEQRGWHSLVFFIGGFLCLIPGVYHVVYIYLAVTQRAGYNLYNLPVFK
ncbi:transmembrane protein 134-like [Pecten maximus]|uniref:transmembrane protein 134-like n=1 Tax=Pecten maximus TaxID=6579 RepID=UPI00145916B8|nr:transmembrane protein 134-like [Pecten maximus]